MPPELGRHLAMTSLWPGDAYAYLGEMNGVAVTCAATLPVDGRLYVAWVATRPEHHRKGYAEAVMRHSLRVASDATGLQRTVLHATDAGLPVYEAMGYVVTSRFGMYAPMDAEADHA
jgi:ribosomal protein S18 acetylase RimI-like enzyme